jgi:hypothetical protein
MEDATCHGLCPSHIYSSDFTDKIDREDEEKHFDGTDYIIACGNSRDPCSPGVQESSHK